jgi:hypothetical protein
VWSQKPAQPSCQGPAEAWLDSHDAPPAAALVQLEKLKPDLGHRIPSGVATGGDTSFAVPPVVTGSNRDFFVVDIRYAVGTRQLVLHSR